MRALDKARAEPGLWLEDVPEPPIGINDVLIRVRKTGICGTDLHIRTQLSAARTGASVEFAISQFTHVKEELSL